MHAEKCFKQIAIQRHFGAILFTKATASQNIVTPSYYRMRDLYFLAVIFAVDIVEVLADYKYLERCNAKDLDNYYLQQLQINKLQVSVIGAALDHQYIVIYQSSP